MDSDTVVHPFVKSEAIRKQMEAIDLYYFPASPPTRAVMLLARALGVVLNLKMVNPMNGDQMKPEFLKLNPMHTIPTMDDNGFVLWESRAIMKYLVDKFDAEGRFKTDDVQHEARINQLLYFDGTTLFPRLANYFGPVIRGLEAPNNEKLSQIEEGLGALNILLTGYKYAGGSHMTAADFSLVATISTMEAVQIDFTNYEYVVEWYERMKTEMDGYDEINQKGADMLGGAFRAKAG